VRAEVAKQAASWEQPIYPHAQFVMQVAQGVNMSTASGTWQERKDWKKFCGQVERSLKQMAESGELVKSIGTYGTEYRTPEQHAEHAAEEARIEAAHEARRAERVRVYDELSLHGIGIESARGREIQLSFASWCVIILALERAGTREESPR
jgi:hypothetical protein